MTGIKQSLIEHQTQLAKCRQCPHMQGPPVFGQANISTVMLIGQAPGFKEIEVHRPFAWTAGTTLFKWFTRIQIEEDHFRNNVYMSAICRCFPGKHAIEKDASGNLLQARRLKTGDRVPSKTEILQCKPWLDREIELLQPALIIPVGKLAINRFLSVNKLSDIIGQVHSIDYQGHNCDLIPLPHPSGASTWPVTEPGKSLLTQALALIEQHPAWIEMLSTH